MLKGKMKIEMTDVHTGETETVLEQNMVTNALANIFKPLGLSKSPNRLLSSYTPYYTNLLGGLLLFDTAIEENPDQLYAPANARMTGCAVYNNQNNTTGTFRGGYNQTESEINLRERYVKFVYDFTTSQANGTIGCVALTHFNAGYTSYGGRDAVFLSSNLGIGMCDGQLQYVNSNYTGANTGDRYSGFTTGKTELLFLIDPEEDCAYYFRIDSASAITITKRRAHLKSVSVFESPNRQKPLLDEYPITDINISGTINYNFDLKDNCLYIAAFPNGANKPGGTFNVVKIALGSWAVTQYPMTNTADVELWTSSGRCALVHDGWLYLKKSAAPYDVYKMEIGNSANIVKLTRSYSGNIDGIPVLAINGRIYYENFDSRLFIANAETNEVLPCEVNHIYGNYREQYCYTPVLHEPMLWFVSCGNSQLVDFIIMGNYLATINNLTEPVTKTSDKTMKVTYIVQEQ